MLGIPLTRQNSHHRVRAIARRLRPKLNLV
jgi:hypothetical protein